MPQTPVNDVHVAPDSRGNWTVSCPGSDGPLSEHRSADEAERAAADIARARHARRVVIHDRYHRPHVYDIRS